MIVTAAVTGSVTTPEQSKYLPVTPKDIADEAVRSYNEGATVVHLHARHPDPAVDDYAALEETIQLIRDRCPIITEVGTGARARDGRLRSDEERLKLMDLNPAPDRETINAGTFTFQVYGGKTAPYGKHGRTWDFSNPPELIVNFTKGMKERGLGIEYEAYDIGHILNIKRLMDWDVLDKDETVHINLVIGIGGCIDPDPRSVIFMVDKLPPHWDWCVMSIGRHSYPVVTLGMILGGHIRVGMEDNLYLERGVLAKSNGELVAKAVRIAKELGREVATIDEAREMMGVKKKQ